MVGSSEVDNTIASRTFATPDSQLADGEFEVQRTKILLEKCRQTANEQPEEGLVGYAGQKQKLVATSVCFPRIVRTPYRGIK